MKLNQIVKQTPLLEQSSSPMELLLALDEHMNEAAVEHERKSGKDVRRSDKWAPLFIYSRPWIYLEGDGRQQVFEDVIRILKTKEFNIRELNTIQDAFGGLSHSMHSLKSDVKESALRVEFLHEKDYLPGPDWVRNANNAIQLINRDAEQLMIYYKCCHELMSWLTQFVYVFAAAKHESPIFDEMDISVARASFRQLGILIP